MDLLDGTDINRIGLFNQTPVHRLLQKLSSGVMATEMENMALAGIISTQLLYHQYILKDSYRPSISPLNNCKVIHEKNPIYT